MSATADSRDGMNDVEVGQRKDALPRGVIAAAVAFLAIQALLPLIPAFSEHRPAPLGWQMFSRASLTLHLDVHYADGRVERVEAGRLVVHSRQDIPFGRLLPPVLCARPGAVLVEVHEGGELRTLQCE